MQPKAAASATDGCATESMQYAFRGPLGIELARILVVGNEVAVIDRFNRRLYVGKKDAVLKKNGLPEDFMRTINAPC